RTDLCGGRPERAVPTAIIDFKANLQSIRLATFRACPQFAPGTGIDINENSKQRQATGTGIDFKAHLQSIRLATFRVYPQFVRLATFRACPQFAPNSPSPIRPAINLLSASRTAGTGSDFNERPEQRG
ncbi:MAG: hypothetical protein P1U77_29365, partial [Rubripirellula sp.]|nr:hypothetical protein [Rubripirellula sp.]